MSKFEIKLPKLGESIEEATILKWHVNEGDIVEEDQSIVDLATDKVDSEIPSPVSGKVEKLFFKEGDIVPVGKVIALINIGGEEEAEMKEIDITEEKSDIFLPDEIKPESSVKSRFYSPLVLKIAESEGVPLNELELIPGNGTNNRLQKQDLLNYLKDRKETPLKNTSETVKLKSITSELGDQVIPMSRMRKLISEHMVKSVHTSAHVTAVLEADVSRLVKWRETNKDEFKRNYGVTLTYMSPFTEAVAMALREFPQVNASTDGENIILRKQVNIGIAVALPDWNLIVPVVKDADQKNITGLAIEINRLAKAARENKLLPDEVTGGTFSITNFGSFKNLFGTPIINQPQVAILATGSIEKKPAVIETPDGDMIAVRHKMFLALTYDHRIVDGALGGAFLRRIADLLENFDTNRKLN